MMLAGTNYLAILIAAAVAYLFGAAYYGFMAKPWMKAARINPEDAKMSAPLLITGFICELVMAWVISGVIAQTRGGEITVLSGMATTFFLWLGLMATVTAVNQRYEGYGWDLTVIDAGHWLGVALIMGAVIGWFGG